MSSCLKLYSATDTTIPHRVGRMNCDPAERSQHETMYLGPRPPITTSMFQIFTIVFEPSHYLGKQRSHENLDDKADGIPLMSDLHEIEQTPYYAVHIIFVVQLQLRAFQTCGFMLEAPKNNTWMPRFCTDRALKPPCLWRRF